MAHFCAGAKNFVKLFTSTGWTLGAPLRRWRRSAFSSIRPEAVLHKWAPLPRAPPPVIPETVITRLVPSRELQTISVWPAEFAALQKDDTAMCENYRITVVEKEEKRRSPTLATYTATFASVAE